MTTEILHRVPHLTTALIGPLEKLERDLLTNQTTIERWLRQQWHQTPPPLYASVDLRNAGFKLAPVDTNLFSAGFNNISAEFMPLCVQAAQATIDKIMPGCSRILLIPENHTRNPYYFESLATLRDILLQAGYDVHIGSLLEDLTEPKEFMLPQSGRTLFLEPIRRVDNRLYVGNFSPCFIVLNNDLSSGVPAVLENLEQLILPSVKLGWSSRLKSNHFKHYKEVAREFAELINIDPWFIDPYFRTCDHVDFLKREGEDQLVAATEDLLQQIQKKYDEYHITQKPFVVIKADAGTYGMGVLSVNSADEIRNLNRKKRTNMAMAKGNRPITQVLLQEGVYTFETWEEAVAEPVVYMIGQHVIGGFYRVHTEKGITENLNAPGMQFVPLAFVQACNVPKQNCTPDDCANRFYSYGVIARLALLAAAREQSEI